MFNKRWKKVLAWSLSVVMVLAIGGLFAANYAVDKLMSSMAGGLDESEDILNSNGVDEVVPTPTPITTTTISGTVSNAPATDDVMTNGDVLTSPTASSVPESASSTSKVTDQPKKQSNTKDKPIAVETAKPTSSASTDKGNDIEGYSAQISNDKANHIKENVTVSEKADVASIVMGQLSVSDIKRLQELASGGLTIEEKREARSIILDKVSEEQYNQLSQIAKKYGVSEGKTKDQVLAEEEALEKGSE